MVTAADTDARAREIAAGDRVLCPVCERGCKVVDRNGLRLSHHGNTLGRGVRGDNYCKGSGRAVARVLAEGTVGS